MKLQALGAVWASTGADAGPPLTIGNTISPNVENDVRYRGMKPGVNLKEMMLFNALAAGHDIAGSIPVLIVNEPMYIAKGENRSVRYNDGYPRWAYNQYRKAVAAEARSSHWNYLDLWKSIPPKYFPHTPLHLSAEGERLLVERINPALKSIACRQ